MSEEYTLDDLDNAKEALTEMHKIFKEKIKSDELKHEGYNDGYSKQFTYAGVTLVQVYDDSKTRVVNNVFYDGDEEFANIEFDGYTNLDSEFEEDINKVLNVYNEFKSETKLIESLKEKTKNMTPSKVDCRLTVSSNAFSYVRNVATQKESDDFAGLMLLLKSQKVDASIYSETNLVGRTSEKQLRDCYKTLSDEERKFHMPESKLERIIEKYGDGKLGFEMSGMLCETPMNYIKNMLEINGISTSKNKSSRKNII